MANYSQYFSDLIQFKCTTYRVTKKAPAYNIYTTRGEEGEKGMSIYSHTYKVLIEYFKFFCDDGSLLSLERLSRSKLLLRESSIKDFQDAADLLYCNVWLFCDFALYIVCFQHL